LEVGERVARVGGDRGVEVGQGQAVLTSLGVQTSTPHQRRAMLRTDPQALRQVGDRLFHSPEITVQKPACTERIG